MLWLVDLSLVVTILLNLVYLVRDPRWLTAAGAVVTTVIGLAAVIRMMQVFPFDFGDSDVWPVVFRVLLWGLPGLDHRHRRGPRHHGPGAVATR